MKKILFLLLCTVSIYSQTYPTNPTAFGKISINTNVESTTATKISVQESNNQINWLQPINIPITTTPSNYTPTAPTLGGHLDGINTKLGTIGTTTAGISTRVWFTADQTTITAGTFDLTNPLNKGTVASHQQTVANDDGQKKYFTTDLIGNPFAMITTFPQGTYAGNLSVSTTPTNANQKFTVELYRCNNAGTPIASGVAGAVTGSLGVTVIMIMDSGEVTLANASVTNLPVSTILGSAFNIAVGERIRYHVSAEKVGTAGGVINESVYYGTSFNSFIDVPVIYNSTSIKDVSTVTSGVGTVTDALNTLNTGKANDGSVVHLSGSETITGQKLFSLPIKVGNGTLSTPSINFYNESASDTGFNHTTTDGVIDVISNGTITATFFNNGFNSFQPLTSVSFIKSGATSTDALLAGGATLSNPISGTGVSGTLSKWTGTGTQGSSLIQESSGNFTANNPVSQYFRIRETNTGNLNTAMIIVDGTTSKFVADYTTTPIPMAFRVSDIDRISINTSGVVNVSNLAGTGSRQVVADASGNLSATDPAPISGTYTPTLTNSANITGATLSVDSYTKVGNVVTVTITVVGSVTVASTVTNITGTLPINRVGTGTDVVGSLTAVGSSFTSPVSGYFQLSGNTTDFSIVSKPIVTGSHTFTGTFSYKTN